MVEPASQVARRHANLKRATHTSTCSHFAEPFSKAGGDQLAVIPSSSPASYLLPAARVWEAGKKRIKKDKNEHPLRPHPHPVCQARCFRKNRPRRRRSPFKMRESRGLIHKFHDEILHSGRTVCDLDQKTERRGEKAGKGPRYVPFPRDFSLLDYIHVISVRRGRKRARRSIIMHNAI